MTQEQIEKLFTVPTPCRFRLGNIRGRVEIKPGEEGVIQVTAVKHLESGDAQNTRIEMSQAEDGSVRVETRCDEPLGWLTFTRSPCKVDYMVRLPRACSLQVSGVSCSASIQGLEGELSFSTVSGALTLKDLSGELHANSVSGQIDGENLSGTLTLGTVSGDVRLDSCWFASLQASTVSAALEVQTPLIGGPYRFRSVFGEVRLAVPLDTACTVTSHSLSGRIVSALHTTHSQVQAGQQRVEIQGGGPEVNHHSVSGDLTLSVWGQLSAEAAVELEDIPPLEPDSPSFPDRWEVLERIDRGELTADEALKILEG